jgi:hypothetical protein
MLAKLDRLECPPNKKHGQILQVTLLLCYFCMCMRDKYFAAHAIALEFMITSKLGQPR